MIEFPAHRREPTVVYPVRGDGKRLGGVYEIPQTSNFLPNSRGKRGRPEAKIIRASGLQYITEFPSLFGLVLCQNGIALPMGAIL